MKRGVSKRDEGDCRRGARRTRERVIDKDGEGSMNKERKGLVVVGEWRW